MPEINNNLLHARNQQKSTNSKILTKTDQSWKLTQKNQFNTKIHFFA